jgi:hypothetical protein
MQPREIPGSGLAGQIGFDSALLLIEDAIASWARGQILMVP